MDEDDYQKLLGILNHVYETSHDESHDELGMTYLDIQKIFYHMRERLDHDNDIVDLLPYYWYIDGIESKTVESTVQWGVEEGILDREPTLETGRGKWYRMDSPDQIQIPESEDYEEAIDAVDVALEEDYDLFAGYEEKIELVYEDTPYPFQQYFKQDVLFEVEKFADDEIFAYDSDTLADKIAVAESFLPLDEEFEEYNAIFGRYVELSQRYLSLLEEDSKPLANSFYELTSDVWILFCRQLRLVEHDPYYEDTLDDWESTYNEKERMVMAQLRTFQDLVDEQISSGETQTEKVPESEPWGQIAASYLDAMDSEE